MSRVPMAESPSVRAVLTVAGSDSSGGAGIQADLKTFWSLDVYGASVVTAITAQNTSGVRAVFDAGPEAIASQIDAVLTDFRPAAVKVGMLRSAANVRVVAERIRRYEAGPVVLDPVLASSSGTRLIDPEGAETLARLLFPLSALVTPNLDEAEALLGVGVRSVDQMKDAARGLHDMGPAHVLVKGGHRESDAVDVFYDGSAMHVLEGKRIEGAGAHGSGCVLSAAIAAYLARGENMASSVRHAKEFTRGAIRARLKLGRGQAISNPLGGAEVPSANV